MNGSWLGRGRGGRLAMYGGCGVVVIFLIFLYRAATLEMARLRELHVQCTHQQEALAAQLQVILEYKMQLEKSLTDEKNSNTAVNRGLQERASDAMQKFNSMKQAYKMLESEQQDTKDKCKWKEEQAAEKIKRLESTLKELKEVNKQALEDRAKVQDKANALESLKTKFLALSEEKSRIERKYEELVKATTNTNSIIEHLKKELFQLNRDYEKIKDSRKELPAELNAASKPSPAGGVNEVNPGAQGAIEEPLTREKPSAKEVSRTKDENAALWREDEEDLGNEQLSKVRFAQKDGKVVPVGPKDQDLKDEREATGPKEPKDEDESPKQVLPPPGDKQDKLLAEGARDALKSSEDPPRKDLKDAQDTQDTLARPDSPREDQDKPRPKEAREWSSARPSSSAKLWQASRASSTPAGDKGLPVPLALPLPAARTGPKVKLPIGVVPIPMMSEQNEQKEQKERKERKDQDEAAERKSRKSEGPKAESSIRKQQRVDNDKLRENPPDWFKVQPGFQEIGDEPNRLGRLAGLEEGGREGEVGDEQYEGIDYYKEPHAKNNDIRMAEAEDEGEDEDDQVDYLNNNPRQNKRE